MNNNYKNKNFSLFRSFTYVPCYSLPFTNNINNTNYNINNINNFSTAHIHYTDKPVNYLFYKPIPSEYIYSKGLPINLYFTIYQLNTSEFTKIIQDEIPIDFVYTVFIKVRHSVDEFFMAAYQFGFNYRHKDIIKSLLDVVTKRLIEYMVLYNLTEESIVYIQISFRQKDKKLLSEFLPVHRDNVSYIPKPDLNNIDSNLSIPVSINEESLGKPLPVDISNGLITHIHMEIGNEPINFLDVIKNNAKILRSKHKDNINSFDDKFKFYLLKDKRDYILAVKVLGSDNLDILSRVLL